MPQWKQVNYKVGTDAGSSEMISFGKGVNTYLSPYVGQNGAIDKSTSPQIDDGIVNQYPILEPRRGFQKSFSDGVVDPFALSVYSVGVIDGPLTVGVWDGPLIHENTKVYAWDGDEWRDATALTGAVDDGRSKFVYFNKGGVLYTIFGNLLELREYTSMLSFSAIADVNAPKTPLLCVDDSRVFALKYKILYFCAAGDHTDWTTANDAGQIEITGMRGNGVGCCVYQNTVIAFSTRTMHVLYGDEVTDYVLSDPIEVGCMSYNAIVEHRGILYFLGYDRKIYAYAGGGMPVEISQPVKYWMDLIYQDSAYNTVHIPCAGIYEKYILFSIPIAQGNYNSHTLVYDTDLKIWQVWNKGIQYFVTVRGELYGFIRNNYLYKIFGSDYTDDALVGGIDTAVAMNYYTGYWSEGTVKSKKSVTSITVHFYLPTGSTMTLGYEADKSGSFTTLYTFSTSSNDQIVRVDSPTSVMYNVAFYRLKFACTGEVKIYSIEPEYRIKRR